MPRQATKAIGNMYYEARMKAAKYNEKLLTRAGAVELLPGVTEECLKKYELDINKPPNVVVALMADAYNAPELRQAYCSNECPLGVYCRELADMPAERALIRLQLSTKDMERIAEALAVIMEDGEVNKEELLAIPSIKERLKEIRNRIDENLAALERAERKE